MVVNGFSDIADEFAREYAYKIYLAPNKQQEHFLDEVLSYRNKLARACGFPTFAHRFD